MSDNQYQGFRMGTTAGAAAQGLVQLWGCLYERGIITGRGPAADAATGRQTGHLQDKRNTRTIIRASAT
jgi:hypothetical protein